MSEKSLRLRYWRLKCYHLKGTSQDKSCQQRPRFSCASEGLEMAGPVKSPRDLLAVDAAQAVKALRQLSAD